MGDIWFCTTCELSGQEGQSVQRVTRADRVVETAPTHGVDPHPGASEPGGCLDREGGTVPGTP